MDIGVRTVSPRYLSEIIPPELDFLDNTSERIMHIEPPSCASKALF